MACHCRQTEGSHHFIHWDDFGGSDHVPATRQVSNHRSRPSTFYLFFSKPLGPSEFLPLLLSVTPTSSSTNGDPLTTGPSGSKPAPPTALSPGDLLPFLNDLAAGFTQDMLADVLTPTLSLFFQEWFKIIPTPDLLGDDWRRFLGAVGLLTQVKGIAAAVSFFPPIVR